MAHWKSQIKQQGIVHTRSIAQAASDQKPFKGESKRKPSHLTKEEADICLNCTKVKCLGGEDCFRARKKEKADAEKRSGTT